MKTFMRENSNIFTIEKWPNISIIFGTKIQIIFIKTKIYFFLKVIQTWHFYQQCRKVKKIRFTWRRKAQTIFRDDMDFLLSLVAKIYAESKGNCEQCNWDISRDIWKLKIARCQFTMLWSSFLHANAISPLSTRFLEFSTAKNMWKDIAFPDQP